MSERTHSYSLAGAPVRLNIDRDLGEVGRQILLANIGDDPVYWLISDTAPSAEPGFKIGRDASHRITLPTAKIWAWAPARGRLLLQPLLGPLGVDAPVTATISIGRTPVRLPAITGVTIGDTIKIYNAGSHPVRSVQARNDVAPDLDVALPLAPGDSDTLEVTAQGDGDIDKWFWCDRQGGSTLLVTLTGDGGIWSI